MMEHLTSRQRASHIRFERDFRRLEQRAKDGGGMLNVWTEFEKLAVYLRISRRDIHGSGFERCVDIANVSADAEFHRRGMFTRLITKLHELTSLPLYLENTQPEFTERLLAHHGWKLFRDNRGLTYDLLHYR